MIHEAVFTVEMKDAKIIYLAIIPEIGAEPMDRSQGICSLSTDNLLTITIHAQDLSALRAALNTWLRLVQVAAEIIERAEI